MQNIRYVVDLVRGQWYKLSVQKQVKLFGITYFLDLFMALSWKLNNYTVCTGSVTVTVLKIQLTSPHLDPIDKVIVNLCEWFDVSHPNVYYLIHIIYMFQSNTSVIIQIKLSYDDIFQLYWVIIRPYIELVQSISYITKHSRIPDAYTE